MIYLMFQITTYYQPIKCKHNSQISIQ